MDWEPTNTSERQRKGTPRSETRGAFASYQPSIRPLRRRILWWRRAPRSGSPPGGPGPHTPRPQSSTALLLLLQLMPTATQVTNALAEHGGTSKASLFMQHSPCPTHLTTTSAKAKEQSSEQSVEQLATSTPASCDRVARCIPVDTTTMATPKAMRKASVGGKAWRLLRLAVLWARKGSAAHSLRLLNTLRRSGLGLRLHGRRNDRLRYGEREFSMDETPAFRFRTPSARVLRFIPCIAPAVPATPLYGDDRYFFRDAREIRDDEGCVGDYYDDGETSECGAESIEDEQLLERAMMEAAEGGEDAGVDVKADEFIAKFYAQMKLQRQISWLQYNEMMQRSVC